MNLLSTPLLIALTLLVPGIWGAVLARFWPQQTDTVPRRRSGDDDRSIINYQI